MANSEVDFAGDGSDEAVIFFFIWYVNFDIIAYSKGVHKIEKQLSEILYNPVWK